MNGPPLSPLIVLTSTPSKNENKLSNEHVDKVDNTNVDNEDGDDDDGRNNDHEDDDATLDDDDGNANYDKIYIFVFTKPSPSGKCYKHTENGHER